MTAANVCSQAEKCVYCEMPLAKRHEHDHFPIPARRGGEETWCVCINCHDLKDRDRFSDHLIEFTVAAQSLFRRAAPVERVWLARMFAMALDAESERVA